LHLPEGERNNGMVSITSKLLKINETYLKANVVEGKKSILGEIYRLNNLMCKPALPPFQINRMVNSCYQKLLEGKPLAEPGKRSIAFKDNSGYGTKRKQEIVGVETGKLRKERRAINVQNAISQLKQEPRKITQELVAEKLNVTARTIQKYWNPFKNEVAVYNRSLHTN